MKQQLLSPEQFEQPVTVSVRRPPLSPTPRNLVSMTVATTKLLEQGWAPLTGYPGSDKPWRLRCLLCGWEGERRYSTVRTRNDLPRITSRHRGCLPEGAAYARWTAWFVRFHRSLGTPAPKTGPDGETFRTNPRTLWKLSTGETADPAVRALTAAVVDRSTDGADELFWLTIP